MVQKPSCCYSKLSELVIASYCKIANQGNKGTRTKYKTSRAAYSILCRTDLQRKKITLTYRRIKIINRRTQTLYRTIHRNNKDLIQSPVTFKVSHIFLILLLFYFISFINKLYHLNLYCITFFCPIIYLNEVRPNQPEGARCRRFSISDQPYITLGLSEIPKLGTQISKTHPKFS